jgi:predicted  nucleic acid-binding Zn-ribbon protein
VPSPRVSIIVTCYNLGEFIEEALDSVRSQTFPDYETIVVDDGSNEPATLEILSRLEARGVRVVRTSNRGLPAARNTGIAATSGEFVCCLDADDRLRPNFLERSVRALDESPEMAFASHWLRTFGDENGEWRPERCDFPSLLDMNSVNGAALVRRHVVESVGGYDESFVHGCEDWDFWISIVEAGHKGTIIPEVLFEYRRRAGSMSRKMIEQIGHPELYGRLIGKHKASYQAHLLSLLLRREATMIDLQSQVREMELEAERYLEPELRGLRDDVRVLEEQSERNRQSREAKAVLASAQHELSETRDALGRAEARAASAESGLASTTDELKHTQGNLMDVQEALADARRALADARQSVHQLEARTRDAEQEVVAFRKSLSWRVTTPFRRLYDLLLDRGGVE